MRSESIRDVLADRHLISTRELREMGFRHEEVGEALKRGLVFKAWPGAVMSEEAFGHQSISDAITCHRTGGVIAFGSAANRHGLADAQNRDLEIIVPHGRPFVPAGLPHEVSLTRTRDKSLMTLGVEEEDVHGIVLRITSPERTILDLFRMAGRRPHYKQHGLMSLKTYLVDNDPGALQDMASSLGLRSMIDPLIDVVREMQEGVRRP